VRGRWAWKSSRGKDDIPSTVSTLCCDLGTEEPFRATRPSAPHVLCNSPCPLARSSPRLSATLEAGRSRWPKRWPLSVNRVTTGEQQWSVTGINWSDNKSLAQASAERHVLCAERFRSGGILILSGCSSWESRARGAWRASHARTGKIVDPTAGCLCPSDVWRTRNVDSQALSPRSRVAQKQQSTGLRLVRLSNH